MGTCLGLDLLFQLTGIQSESGRKNCVILVKEIVMYNTVQLATFVAVVGPVTCTIPSHPSLLSTMDPLLKKSKQGVLVAKKS